MFLWIRGDKRPALRLAGERIRTFLCLVLVRAALTSALNRIWNAGSAAVLPTSGTPRYHPT